MSLILRDRVRQTSTTAGTGTITLSGSVTGYQNFSVIGSGNTTYYTIIDAAGNWEIGLGTYTSPNQLSRDTVYESSNANALINFSSASKDVFVTFPAEGFSSPPAIGDTTPNTIKGTSVSGNTFTAIVSSQTGNALNSATNTTYGTVKVLPITGGLPRIEFDGTPEGYEKLTIEVDPYFTGIRFTATGAYGSVFYSPITFVDTTTNNEAVSIKAAAGSTSYVLSLPATSGSANQIIKTDGSGNLDWITQGVQGTAPITITAATYTVAATDQWIIGNRAGTITLTLPTASSNVGRSINVKTITANTVVSASSNVVQRGSTTVSTAILAASAGTWATLVSDGTNWVIMAGN